MTSWTDDVGVDVLVTALAVAMLPAVEGFYAILVRWGVAHVEP